MTLFFYPARVVSQQSFPIRKFTLLWCPLSRTNKIISHHHPLRILSFSLKPGMTSVLKNLTSALKKFGHGDRMNAPRVLKLIEPMGLAIAVSSGLDERLECVAALFKLLGSDSFRKDEEIGLVIGEALALFAEAYNTAQDNISSETSVENWSLDMDEGFGRTLSPPAQVSKNVIDWHQKVCSKDLTPFLAFAGRLYVAPNGKIDFQ